MKKLFISCTVTAVAFILASCDKDSTETGTPENPPSDSLLIESILINPSSLELEAGDSATLTPIILPKQSGTVVLEWTSSDNTVATVSASGTVTALSKGTATVTASSGEVHGSSTITVTAGKTEPPADEPEVGDYFYSDGTWSSDLDADKKVIGIVFYTGNPAKDDPTLQADHPECTHGLAVAISGDEYVPWQSAYLLYGRTVDEWVRANTEFTSIATSSNSDDNINKMLGYNNTCAIEAFNADPANSLWPVEAVQAVLQYRETNPAPAGTSDWYLPSIKEYIIMCYKETDAYIGTLPGSDNYDMLNAKLETLPVAQLIGTDGFGFYSSSTEEVNAIDKAYAISFCYKMVATNSKDNSSLYSTRFILAF